MLFSSTCAQRSESILISILENSCDFDTKMRSMREDRFAKNQTKDNRKGQYQENMEVEGELNWRTFSAVILAVCG